jgi:hypothetical protein
MYIELACGGCGASSSVPYARLYELWKQGYDKLSPEKKKTASCMTNIRCHCGHVDTYDSPMFRYVFQLIFDECIKESTTT